MREGDDAKRSMLSRQRRQQHKQGEGPEMRTITITAPSKPLQPIIFLLAELQGGVGCYIYYTKDANFREKKKLKLLRMDVAKPP